MTALLEPLLGVRHGFAVPGGQEPPDLARARQVHGAAVVRAEACLAVAAPPEADAVVSVTHGVGACVVTADCVPVLLAVRDGRGVAAVHAGWRGLAAGVVEAGVSALAQAAGAAPSELRAGIGPHARACCYEVDGPVLDALAERHAEFLSASTRPTRPGHALLDLGAVARDALLRAGLESTAVGSAASACTVCDPRGFASHRRDGPRAGRLVHFVTPP